MPAAFVTGGSGFIGGRLIERLRAEGWAVRALARSLDEREIALEVARGVSQLIACDSVVVVHPDLDRSTVNPLVRLVGGSELPLPEVGADGVRVHALDRELGAGAPGRHG